MANAYVYILRCADDSFYVGSTTNLELRLWQHQQGAGSAYTRRRGRRPVELVYVEEFESIRAAFEREKQIQGWSRAKRIALIEHRYTDLPTLAEAYALKRRRGAAREQTTGRAIDESS
jgi:putative endonuclease